MLHFGCPKCRLALIAHQGTEGSRSRCRCGHKFTIPEKKKKLFAECIKASPIDFHSAVTASIPNENPERDDAVLEMDIRSIRRARFRDRLRVRMLHDQYALKVSLLLFLLAILLYGSMR